MPSLFPISSTIYKERIITSFTVPTLASNTYSGIWEPEIARGASRISFTTSTGDLNDNQNPNDNRTQVTVGLPSAEVDADPYNQVAHGGVRLIGAYLKIEYMGTVENAKGLIEVGMHLNAHHSTIDSQQQFQDDLSSMHFASAREIQQLPYY